MARPIARRHDPHGRAGPLFLGVAVGTGLIALWLVARLIGATLGWAGNALDDLRYGSPRTDQAEGVIWSGGALGLGVHLTAQNIEGRIWITIVPRTEQGPVVVIKGPQLLGAHRDLLHPQVALRTDAGATRVVLRLADQAIVYRYDPRRHTFSLLPKDQGGR